MYKLISLDLDGTLLNTDQTISKRNLDAIKKCHDLGIETVVATGRPPRFTIPLLPKVLTNEYCICYNGAKIFYRGELIDETFLTEKSAKEILLSMNGLNHKIGLEIDDQIYANFDISDSWNVSYLPIEDIRSYGRICKIIIINEEVPVDKLKENFKDTCNIMITDSGKLIEIISGDISKYKAIEKVVKRMGISVNEVIAFGDDYNDLEIIEGVGLGVAMGNAVEKVKELSTTITATNNEDGVAIVLEEVFYE